MQEGQITGASSDQIILDYLKSIKGKKELDGSSKCKIYITLGNKKSVITETNLGDCEFDFRFLGEFANITITPKELTDLNTAAGVLESYINLAQNPVTDPDDENILCITFAPNEDYWDGYVMMVNPIAWFYTSERPLEISNSLRLLFTRTSVVYTSPELDNEQDGPDDGYLF